MAEFSFEWHGDKVQDDILTSCTEALNILAIQGQAEIRERAPVLTGFLRDSVYAFVDSTGGVGSRTPALIMGAAAEYALEVELGTRFMPGRPFILQGAQIIVPLIVPTIVGVLGGKGYSGTSAFGSAGPGLPNPYTGGYLSELLPSSLVEAPLNP